MKNNKLSLLMLAAFLGVAGCAPQQPAPEANKISAGTVQREIRNGLSGAEVIEALGSPNIVTTDAQRRETWVYDKVSTERVSSSSNGGIWLVIVGGGGSSSSSSTSQRTLTIIIKFDEKGLVRDYSYRQSSF